MEKGEVSLKIFIKKEGKKLRKSKKKIYFFFWIFLKKNFRKMNIKIKRNILIFLGIIKKNLENLLETEKT